MFRSHGWVFLPVGILLFLAGVYVFFIVAVDLADEAERVSTLPGDDPASFANLQTGTEAVITGTLADNQRASSPNARVEQVIRQLDLVAYVVEDWHVSSRSSSHEDGETRYYGEWEYQSHFMPEALSLTYGENTVFVSGSPDMDRCPHSDVRNIPNDGNPATYDGQSLDPGSLRVSGYQNGDMLTVVGTVQSPTAFQASTLYGGTRSAYIDSLHGEAGNQRFGGVVVMVIGVVFALVGLTQMGALNRFGGGEQTLSPEELAQRAR